MKLKWVTILIVICAFFLLRPYHLQESGLLYGGDDYSYFAHSSAMIYGEFPSYEKESFSLGKKSPLNSIGPALLALPFVFTFSLIDRAVGSDIVVRRTPENIPHSWSAFGFVFASSFYFWVACFLLYRGLRYYFKGRIASLAIILMVLCQGLPLYVFRRPVFSHVYEFFLQSLVVFVLLKIYRKNDLGPLKYWVVTLLGGVAGLIFLVRFNNIFAALLWPLVLMINRSTTKNKARIFKSLALTYGVFAIVVFVFKLLPDFYNNPQGYSWVGAQLSQVYPISFYLKRVFYILSGFDWGLIYTAPFVLVSLVGLFFLRFPLKRRLLLCLLPLAVNLYIIIVWQEQGCWYGYRYFVTSIIPLLVYPLAIILKRVEEKFPRKLEWACVAIALIPILSMLCFEGNASNLTLSLIKLYPEAPIAWGNVTYQLEVWKTLFLHPVEFLVVVFKGGLFYLVYLGAVLFSFVDKLPTIVSQKYPVFQVQVAVRVLILYLLPFLLYWITTKNRLLCEEKIK